MIDIAIAIEISEAEGIIADASLRADSCNGWVVDRALREVHHNRQKQIPFAHNNCPNCNYRLNNHRFQELLSRYTKAVVLQGQIKKKMRGDWNYDGYIPDRDLESENYKVAVLIMDLKEEMKKISPCSECILSFNPTGKRRFMGFDVSDRRIAV